MFARLVERGVYGFEALLLELLKGRTGTLDGWLVQCINESDKLHASSRLILLRCVTLAVVSNEAFFICTNVIHPGRRCAATSNRRRCSERTAAATWRYINVTKVPRIADLRQVPNNRHLPCKAHPKSAGHTRTPPHTHTRVTATSPPSSASSPSRTPSPPCPPRPGSPRRPS